LVVPVFNEAESLPQLYREIEEALGDEGYEIIFVDDGSRDGSLKVLAHLANEHPQIRVLRFRRNFGKAEALYAGFKEARGEIVVTLDADLQDDPAEIPRLVAAVVEEGYDLASGWKSPRRDPPSKTVPSRLFNWVTARLTGLPLHDFNSGFKAYRRQILGSLPLYGAQYRFIPAFAHWQGYRVTEVPVAHRPRRHGRSKYGWGRLLAGFLDLFTMLFLTRFRRRPLHLFGSLGLVCLIAGLIINAYLTVLWFGGEVLSQRPLLLLGVLLMVMGVQFLSIGLLGEMLSRSHGGGEQERPAYEEIEAEEVLHSGAVRPQGEEAPPPQSVSASRTQAGLD